MERSLLVNHDTDIIHFEFDSSHFNQTPTHPIPIIPIHWNIGIWFGFVRLFYEVWCVVLCVFVSNVR